MSSRSARIRLRGKWPGGCARIAQDAGRARNPRRRLDGRRHRSRPGHTPQDAGLVVDAAEGRHAFTHLWWRSDRTSEVDPYSTDPAELARNRRRLLDGVDVVIPGHGAPFRVR